MGTRTGAFSMVAALACMGASILPATTAQTAARPSAGTTESLASAMATAADAIPAPDDPVATAEFLVHEIVSADEMDAATGALAELLRRSGLPIVSIEGQLLGLPDFAGYPEAPVEIELLQGVARSLRSGRSFHITDVADLFVTLGITDAAPSWSTLSFVLGSYGKGDVPGFIATAGGAIRALAAERAAPLDPFAADTDQRLDPVQMILATTQLGLEPSLRDDAAAFTDAGTAPNGFVAPRPTADGGCANVKDSFKTLDSMSPAQKALVDSLRAYFDVLQTHLGQHFDTMAEQGKLLSWESKGWGGLKRFTSGLGAAQSAAKYVSLMLLINGLDVEVSGTKSTHYKHRDGENSRNVNLTANVTFASGLNLSKATVACFNLAGLDIPPDGPVEGQTVEWSYDQEYRLTTGGKSVAHLAPVAGASTVAGAFTRTTDANGAATWELTPPVENFPGEGAENTATVAVRAKLTKDDADWEVGDFLNILKGCATGGPAGCVAGGIDSVKEAGIRKLTELGVNALLPMEEFDVTVTYHGAEPIVVRGRVDNYFALTYMVKSVEVDLVSCAEREGPWIGTATFGGVDINGLGGMIKDSGLPGASSLPNHTSAITRQVSLDLPDPANPPVWELIHGDGGPLVRGQLKLLPDNEDWSKVVVFRGGSVGSPVGELTIGIADIPNFLATDLSFTAYRVKSDPRCGGDPPFHWERG